MARELRAVRAELAELRALLLSRAEVSAPADGGGHASPAGSRAP